MYINLLMTKMFIKFRNNSKQIVLIALLLFISSLLSMNCLAFENITIDPGHGGKDMGCVGPNGTMEKDINLSVAKRLADIIHDRLGIYTTLTRQGDDYIDLTERTGIANNSKADIFISIHANSSFSSEDTGRMEIFVCSDDLGMGDLSQTVKESDPMEKGAANPTLWDMMQVTISNESLAFANILAEEAKKSGIWREAVVKSAPIFVLKGASMAAIEVELDFLSSPLGEDRLRSDWYQERMCEIIYRAVLRLKNITKADPNVSI